MKTKNPYVVIPRKLIEEIKLDDLRIPIYIYFSSMRTIRDIVGFSIDRLAIFCGYRPNIHKGMINDKCKTIFNDFVNMNMFADFPDNINQLKHNDYIEVKLNYEWFDFNSNFAYIDLPEIDIIIDFKKYVDKESRYSRITVSKLLLLLSYIRVNKLRRTELQTNTHPENKPEFFYRQYKSIGIDLGWHEDTVTIGVSILNQLNIIVSKDINRYQDSNGNWHTDVILFVDKHNGWEQELIWGEAHLKSMKKKKYKQNIEDG